MNFLNIREVNQSEAEQADEQMTEQRNWYLRRLSLLIVISIGATAWATCTVVGESRNNERTSLSLKEVADLFHAVVSANRAVYSLVVVNRLAVQDKVIAANEHYHEKKALPLPAQVFRLGAELAAEKNRNVFYSLHSYWPLNKKNSPRTPMEKQGLGYVTIKNENFYGVEMIDDKKYFIAVYPDKATDHSCVTCHNTHKDSPRRDFKLGEVMGGVVIRLPLRN